MKKKKENKKKIAYLLACSYHYSDFIEKWIPILQT